MPEVLEAQRAYKRADEEALKLKFRARAYLGLAVLRHRQKTGDTQADVAERLGVVSEQVRRYEAAYRRWQKEHANEPLED